MLGEKFFAHARLVVEAVQRSFGGDLYQIAIAFFVFCQHQQMVVGIAFGRSALDVVIVFFADVEFAADDRLDSVFLRGIDKVHCAENVAVIGHRDGRHAEFLHAGAEFFDVAGAIEQGVISV